MRKQTQRGRPRGAQDSSQGIAASLAALGCCRAVSRRTTLRGACACARAGPWLASDLKGLVRGRFLIPHIVPANFEKEDLCPAKVET